MAVEEKPCGETPERAQAHVPDKGGGRLGPATATLWGVISEEALQAIWLTGIARATAGDVRGAELIMAYLNGTPIARLEVGAPGAFTAPDPTAFTPEELKAYVKAASARLGREGDEEA